LTLNPGGVTRFIFLVLLAIIGSFGCKKDNNSDDESFVPLQLLFANAGPDTTVNLLLKGSG
jgi:hypothetical protein